MQKSVTAGSLAKEPAPGDVSAAVSITSVKTTQVEIASLKIEVERAVCFAVDAQSFIPSVVDPEQAEKNGVGLCPGSSLDSSVDALIHPIVSALLLPSAFVAHKDWGSP